jgi:hypothetical protein
MPGGPDQGLSLEFVLWPDTVCQSVFKEEMS